MKKNIVWVVVILFFFPSFVFSKVKPSTRIENIKHVEPGRWAFSFQGFGEIPINPTIRDEYRSGFGVATRLGYGFWEGLSVEGEFQYDLLFRENGPTPDQGNKNLWSLSPGLRYTTNILQEDIAWYSFGLTGITFDYTKGNQGKIAVHLGAGTGLDFNLTDKFSIGPIFKYRFFIENDDIHLISMGAAFTYLFD